MRLFYFFDTKSRLVCLAILACLIVGCGGGGGGQQPILGNPGISVSSPPQIILTTPAKTIPIITGIPINIKITAKFNRNMSPGTVNDASFTVLCPTASPAARSGLVAYDIQNQLASFQPTGGLPVNTTCTATVSSAVTDTNQLAMASNYSWSFTTALTQDKTPPLITVTSPLDSSTNVCLTKVLSATFNKTMDPTTVTSNSFYVTDPQNSLISGLDSYDSPSNTASFTVNNPPGFAANTLYTIKLTAGIKDLAGNSLAPTSFSFTTGAQSCTPPPVVNLRSIATYGAFGGNAGVTNQGINTIINGDLGTTAACTLFTGLHDATNIFTETTLNIGQVTGTAFCGPPAPGTNASLALENQAAIDALAAYNGLVAMSPTIILGPNSGNLAGLTVAPGIYRPIPASFLLTKGVSDTGNLTLDASGDPNAVWIFQMPESLTIGLIATPSQVILINGANPKNVYWQVGSHARIEDGSTVVGTIIASAGITISTANQVIQTTLTGRAIGLNASVTMVNTTIVAP